MAQEHVELAHGHDEVAQGHAELAHGHDESGAGTRRHGSRLLEYSTRERRLLGSNCTVVSDCKHCVSQIAVIVQ